jgi:hypothetical protein
MTTTACTKSEYARRKGVSPAAITKAERTGRIVVLPDGRVDVVASDAVWERKTDAVQSARANAPKRRAAAIAQSAQPCVAVSPLQDLHAKPEMSQHNPPPHTPDLDPAEPTVPLNRVIYDFEAARAKRETHAANIAEMEERKRAGELCETSAVLMTMTTIGSNFRTALERVADKLADRVAAEPDPHTCHQIISGEIAQALDQLAKDCEAVGRDLTGGRNGRE